ncbi:MAG: hypothetical protein WDN72_04760 [Alphaproteobacteria bacterium]
MCCTFGDDTDKEWWEKHKLETRIVLDKYGKLRNLPEGFTDLEGKKVSNPDPKNPGARELILTKLQDAGPAHREQADHPRRKNRRTLRRAAGDPPQRAMVRPAAR